MTMDERIAKAIHASLTDAPSMDEDHRWTAMQSAEKAPFLTAARRVLHVMRNPTSGMLGEGDASRARDAANIWERMIYRALHERE